MIMVSAFKLIDNRQTQTDFNQSVRDTQSQLQAWINEVSAGFTGADPNKDSCSTQLISGVQRPVLQPNLPGPGYTPACVFLGKVFQFPPDNTQGSTIYAYPVFGVRDNNGILPTTLQASNPEPAVGQAGVDLTQSFSLLPLYVKSVTSSGVGSSYTASHLAGFFTSINTEGSTASNGESDVNAYQYDNFNGSPPFAADQSGNAVVPCVEMTGSCLPTKLKQMKICLTDGKSFAQITIDSSLGLGASVNLQYVNC